MKIALWSLFALAALLWTGGAALTAQLVQWSAQGLGSVDLSALGSATTAVALPPWLGPWIDTAAWAALLQTLGALLAGAAALLPALGGLAGWLVPAVWVAWGLGLLALLGATLAGSWLLRRLLDPVRGGPRAA